MKKIKIILIVMLQLTLGLSSCASKDDLGESELDITTPELTDLDVWIRDNYTFDYNIEVLYRWNENAVDRNRYLFPPTAEKVQPALAAIKKIWIDTYTEVGGEDFIKKIAPREVLLVGGINLNPSGTITLGVAEGGKRITFFNTDLVDLKDKASLVRFVSTMQHEYAHILNQTVPFDEEEFQAITPFNYTAQWFNESIEQANELGYITDYARASVTEDFAEMVNAMLSNSADEYNAILTGIQDRVVAREVAVAVNSLPADATPETIQAVTDAVTLTASNVAQIAINAIRTKEGLVAEYFKTNFDLDIYQLQEVAARNTLEVLNN